VVLSVSTTLYIVNNPLRTPKRGVQVGVTEAETVLTPDELLVKAEPTPVAPISETTSNDEPTTEPEDGVADHVIFPKWQASALRITGAQPVTEKGDYTSPVWSPVGLDIAYTRTDQTGIYVTGTDANSTRTLSDDVKIGSHFSWNLDGMSLHVRQPDSQFVELMITGEKYPAVERQPKVIERDNLIYVINEDESLRRVSGNQDRFFSPQLSPDETKVVYIGRETGIYIAALDGSRTINVGEGTNPTWLPDSSGIVYDLPVSDGATVVDGDVWFASATGTERANLTSTPGIVESNPAVAPDGERIAFGSNGIIYVGILNRSKKQEAAAR
jgi:Tol biopolymer transport system component